MLPKLLIKFPTRQRPGKFFETLDKYIELLDNPGSTTIFVAMDEDDTSMNNGLVKSKLQKYNQVQMIWSYGQSKNKIEAVNAQMPPMDWDILLLASDDMIPQDKGYDTIIKAKMLEHFPDMDGVLWFNDGYQGEKLDTCCIIGRTYYERWHYIYNPVYVTWYADNEFTLTAQKLNRIVYDAHVLIRHEHPDNGVGKYDELYRKNAISGVDCNIFHKRQDFNFFIKRVLIIQPGRYGDIIICLPIAKHYHENNWIVHWLCPEEYHAMFRNINYAQPVTSKDYVYDMELDLSFGFGGEPEQWWQNLKDRFDSFVSAKYHLAGLRISLRWKLQWKRDKIKEMALYYIITEKYGNNYVLVHEQTHCGKYITVNMENKVVFEPIDNFNVFDWYEVIMQAREIYCIDSSLSNFIEAVPEFRHKDKAIMLSAREEFNYLKSIYINGWTIG